jgi:hypothetical protein
MMIHFDNTCDLYCTDNEKTVSAEVAHFRPEDGLTVYIAESKLVMKYKKTAGVYIGNLMGMEFTTPGPKYYETKQGRR